MSPTRPETDTTTAPRGSAPVQPPLPPLEIAEIRRYGRHLILPEVGMEGQQKLKAARVLLVGAGGLGSPLGLYLAAAGVGTLGLIDFDTVDETNLQRQVLYATSDVGRPKLEAAADRLQGINPQLNLELHPTRLDAGNALELFERYDLVADGSDNFPTRYLVNDACVLTGTPNVYGSIFRFEGQVSVFGAPDGPCYRCLFAEPPPPGMVPSCAEGGVLGVLPGIIGSLQANEVLKWILGIGEPLVGRLVLFDALRMRFRELKLGKNPSCPVCSERPTQTGLVNYEQLCGIEKPSGIKKPSGIEEDRPMEATPKPTAPTAAEGADDGWNVSPRQLKAKLAEGRDLVVLDVRNPPELAICRIDGSVVIPLPELQGRIDELDPTRETVVHCHSGVRSMQATQWLRSQGFENVRNLRGGIDAWSVEVDPSVPRY
jgi:adenylyltransferase/sulfurtransferase